MSLFHEAGIFGLIVPLTFAVGLVALLRARASGGTFSVGATFGALLLALGQVGQGLGQRAVDAYVDRVPDTAQKVIALSVGTREASASLILGGAAAALLVLLATALHKADAPSR